MRLLFEMDAHDYPAEGTRFTRPSVRGIILRGGRIAMVRSLDNDYYKFPGGGIEPGEDHAQTLIREVAEETGLVVRPDTIREYGMVHRIERGDPEDIFEQDNYYYFCETEPEPGAQRLTETERRERFTLEYADPAAVIAANRESARGAARRAFHSKYSRMLRREALVMEMLMKEGYL